MSENKLIGIIGLGKFGNYLANELVKNNRKIICIDKDESKVKKVLGISEACFVSDDISTKTLEETGFKGCDAIIICISEHMDVAIFATLNSLALGVEKVIALSNSEEQGIVLEKLGAEVIYPYKDSADRLVKKIANNNFLDYISLNDDVEIVEVKVPKRYVGVTIIDSDIRQKFGLNIIAIDTDGIISTNINPSYILKEEDCLVFIGDKAALKKFQEVK